MSTKRVLKIVDGCCPKCGEGEFVSEPNQYDVLVFSDGQLQINHTESFDYFKIFCRECGVEISEK